MAAGPVSPKDHQATPPVVPVLMMEDVIAKDVILAWFREEFTAANAIIDALCSHLARWVRFRSESGVHGHSRRRLNWIPVLQMQKYHSIADVALKLKRVTETKLELDGKMTGEVSDEKVKIKVVNGHVVEEEEDDSPDSDITDSG
ncbi:hypothetical protein H0E87_005384, partial [Populus deltoides]